MTAVSKNVYFNVLHNIFNKYNNTVHKTITMKSTEVAYDSYADSNEDSNKKYRKSKVGDRVRISKYKSFFAKEFAQNWSKDVLIISKIKNTLINLCY